MRRGPSWTEPPGNRVLAGIVNALAGVEQSAVGFDIPVKVVRCCRACELSCPWVEPAVD